MLKETILFLSIMIIFFVGCGINQKQVKTMEEVDYSIPYKAKGEYSGIYDNLVEKDLADSSVQRVISRAKEVAIAAGYKLSGAKLETYNYEGKNYPVRIIVYENPRYYLVEFIPVGTPRSSLNLEISIEKESNEIVTILQGS